MGRYWVAAVIGAENWCRRFGGQELAFFIDTRIGNKGGPSSKAMNDELVRSEAGINRTPPRRSSSVRDVLFVLACFSFFMAVASLVGSLLPALVEGNCLYWTFAGPKWRVFWTILVNGIAAGFALGALCGLLRTIFYWMREGYNTQAYADHALKTLQAPLFILGAANGLLVAILTTARFGKTWIWEWLRNS